VPGEECRDQDRQVCGRVVQHVLGLPSSVPGGACFVGV